MWIEITPRRPDFCGSPPCPLCYRWGENNGVSMTGLERMSLELTGKFLDELTEAEKDELQKVADRIHAGALMVPAPPLAEPPPVADLGMSDAAHIDGWLAQHKAPAAPIKPLQLTLDQRDDWQAPAEKAVEDAAKKIKQKEKAAAMIMDDPIANILSKDRALERMMQVYSQVSPSYFWNTSVKDKDIR